MDNEDNNKAGHREGTNGSRDAAEEAAVFERLAKENVLFLGIQKVPKGPALVLVNNESGSTVAYNPERHNIINMNGYVRFVLGVYSGRKESG